MIHSLVALLSSAALACAGSQAAFVSTPTGLGQSQAWKSQRSLNTPKVPVRQQARMAAMADPVSQLDEDAAKALDGETSDFSRARQFPLAAVVGQEAIKTALLLACVNPAIGGVVIGGGRGTAKSVMARAIHALLPPIQRVKDSQYNIDPESNEVDSALQAELDKSGKSLSDLETEVIETPFVQLPVDVLEDRLLGSVDIEKSVTTGVTVFEPGLLARAHRGVLFIDDINLLDESISNLLLSVISDGFVQIEREGLSVQYPCKPIMLATFNPEEAELRNHLLDRIGVSLSADAWEMGMDDRIKAVDAALAYSNDPDAVIGEYKEGTEEMKTNIVFAREFIKDMELQKAQKLYLVEEAIRAGVQGHRAELFAMEVSRAHAALRGSDRVEAEDLRMGVKLAIAPRGTEIQIPPDEDMQQPPPPPPPPPQMEEEDQDEDEKEKEEEEEQEEQEPEEEQEAPPVPQEFMFDVEGVALDPEILQFANKANAGRSGKSGMIFSEERGRYIKAMLPKGKVRKLAVDATLRTAAPFQKRRRERAESGIGKKKPVYIETSDVRQKRMARKAGSLIVFVVDASGSMALNRMNAAKGAAVNLLNQAYQSRDKICLVSFQGDAAQVLLPPTRSIAMAKNRLERMPCGGGSPLAHALNQAAQVGITAQKTGDVGEVLVVCISDGRANVPLANADPLYDPELADKVDKDELKEEVLQAAQIIGSMRSFKVLMIDTENKFVSTGFAKEIAKAANGRYHYIPKATGQAMAQVAGQALTEMKG